MMTLDVYFAKAHEFMNHACNVVDEMCAITNDERTFGCAEDEQLCKFVQFSTELTVLESLISALHEQTKELSDMSSIKKLVELFNTAENEKGRKDEAIGD